MADEIPAIVTTFARVLRILALTATVAAIIVMATSRDTATVPGTNVVIKLDYSDLGFFKAFLGANIAASIYGFVATALPSKSPLWRLLVIFDVLVCMLLTSIDSVSMGVAYLHKEGNSQAFWPPICGQVPNYCNRVIAAIITGFVGVGLYLGLIIYAISFILNPLLISS